jgi:hypothetical protein
MNKLFAVILLLLATSLALSCGSSSRQLQSITISQTVNGEQIQFVATGTFSAPPTTVTPLPAWWTFAPPGGHYTLTTQPFVLQCTVSGPYPSPIIAWAPADANAPSSGSLSGIRMVTGSTGATCP